ncbi:MAG: valine--tRNA ligase [Gammaproteobacteria bacterium]
MDKTYDPKAIEARWYQCWEDGGHFQPQHMNDNAPPFCIMLPPPNVTGTLHMGHAFNNTVMDTLTRYHRMRGHNTLWQPGTDHAGIATQMVVERQLQAEGKSRHDLGREKFVERAWNWKQQSGNTITNQLRRLGSSLDWSRERFTLDADLSAAVQKVFIDLYNEGLIYRGKRLVNWDPVLHTAISDLEVLSEEENGSMWHMKYPLEDGSGHVIVATTRPETMLGDAAVAVHPDDERYQYLIGKKIQLPLTDHSIPVIADDYVDPEFGSGCVKITPAHDFNDYDVWTRHKDETAIAALPEGGLLNIFTIDAAMNDAVPESYRGLDRFKARKQIVADLEAVGLLEKVEPHKLMVPRGDRSGAVVEPYLTDQWYVKVAPLAAPAIQAVEDGRIKFVPENWTKTYFDWMRNIQDWCISRQLWWGHRIPAWYDADGNIYVGNNEAETRAQHKLGDEVALTQDEDVLDTWFSSALWPFSTLGWPQDTPELKTFYPTSVLVTGFDIIFFWVARMIMLGIKFMGDVPFREVYIHALVRDSEGQKMSKSKGNVLDPLDLIDGIDLEALLQKRTSGLMQPQQAEKIEKQTRKHFPDGIDAYGTDSLRFTFASLAGPGRDIKFDIGRIEGYRNFCNKLWNATRYVMLSVDGEDTGLDESKPVELGLAERWIIARLQVAEREVNELLGQYRFDLAAQAIYEFAWDEYCDWYLELSKVTLTGSSSDAAKRGTRRTLVRVLETLLRLAHPIIPYITEELWQKVAPLALIKMAGKKQPDADTASIMLQPYPQPDASKHDETALITIDWLKTFLLGVRRIRAEFNIAPGKPLAIEVSGGNAQEQDWLNEHQTYLSQLGRLESITPVDAVIADAATALAGDMTIAIPLAGLIDKDAEVARLNKELEKNRAEQQRISSKLANESFVERAPAAVVDKERQRHDELNSIINKLEQQIERMQAL